MTAKAFEALLASGLKLTVQRLRAPLSRFLGSLRRRSQSVRLFPCAMYTRLAQFCGWLGRGPVRLVHRGGRARGLEARDGSALNRRLLALLEQKQPASAVHRFEADEPQLRRGRESSPRKLPNQGERLSALVQQLRTLPDACAPGARRRRVKLAQQRRAREWQRRLDAGLVLNAQPRPDGAAAESSEQTGASAAPASARPAGAWMSAKTNEAGACSSERLASSSELAVDPRCNLFALSSLVAERAAEFPDAFEEWHAYLRSLESHIDAEGYLPPWLERLVEDVFAPLLSPS